MWEESPRTRLHTNTETTKQDGETPKYAKMNNLTFVVIFATLLCFGESLKCNHCIASGQHGRCTTTVQTCGYMEDRCLSMYFKPPMYGYARRCAKEKDCIVLQAMGGNSLTARCCETDRCN
ncbi:CD59 glycoprotein-like [Acipenser oxyrinchus oxyrinchus]|uniref:CD59 glycoprotein-like n=1 Tax=Acipenser oxyrinchus oxyrinchus TaxID=40147 RepID=A0AAD8CJ20_ACIOX|nr:CD59 glycoprotein-like [Acipenser oxyrinchus oxyrinchus]